MLQQTDVPTVMSEISTLDDVPGRPGETGGRVLARCRRAEGHGRPAEDDRRGRVRRNSVQRERRIADVRALRVDNDRVRPAERQGDRIEKTAVRPEGQGGEHLVVRAEDGDLGAATDRRPDRHIGDLETYPLAGRRVERERGRVARGGDGDRDRRAAGNDRRSKCRRHGRYKARAGNGEEDQRPDARSPPGTGRTALGGHGVRPPASKRVPRAGILGINRGVRAA